LIRIPERDVGLTPGGGLELEPGEIEVGQIRGIQKRIVVAESELPIEAYAQEEQ
jgi:hypothetical protein